MTDSVPDDLGAAPTLRALAAGETLSDRYVLEAWVGAGSMGEVWRAKDGVLGVTVALKVLPPVLGRDERSVNQLVDEVTRTRGLTHDQIVRLYDFGEDKNRGVSFLTMAFVDGKTVDRLVRERGGGLPVEEVLKWGRDVASALDYAHEKGLLHRDVKPSNVMVDADGRGKLMDFGIAREVRDAEGSVTGRGDTSGTLRYMSPEHLGGKMSRSDDIYSLSATLYEALRGRPPFETGDLAYQIRNVAAPAIECVPREVDEAVRRGLSKKAADRPQTAVKLLDSIAAAAREAAAREAAEAREAEARAAADREAEAARAAAEARAAADREAEAARARKAALRSELGVSWWSGVLPWASGGLAVLVVLFASLWLSAKGGAGPGSEASNVAELEKARTEANAKAAAAERALAAANGKVADLEKARTEANGKVADLEKARTEANAKAAAAEPALAAANGKVARLKGQPASVAFGSMVVDLGNGVSMRLVEIKPGGFMMGSPDSEPGRDGDETQHAVRISKPFWLGQTEVTQSQWQAVMGRNPSRFREGADAANRPVEQVSWFDAVEFCNALTRAVNAANPDLKLTECYRIEQVERDGDDRITAAEVSWISGSTGFRLPTEAEWEYACRAGSQTAYSFGNDANRLGEYGWFGDNSGRTTLDADEIWKTDRSNYSQRLLNNECRTHAVKERLANDWGLFDMHGNVWEWCADWYGTYPSGSVTDPRGPSTGTARVLRGGSWYVISRGCRAAVRVSGDPASRDVGDGFRVARTP